MPPILRLRAPRCPVKIYLSPDLIDSALVSTTAWKDFLPRNTLVMAKPRPYTAPAEITLTGEGPSNAQLIFVTAEESTAPASELLHKMIEAMGLKRTEVLIAHIDEAGSLKMSDLQPQIIVALGEPISKKLLVSSAPLGEVRGIFKPFQGAKLLATFHPEDLLKKPELKKAVWADLQNVAKELGISIPSRK